MAPSQQEGRVRRGVQEAPSVQKHKLHTVETLQRPSWRKSLTGRLEGQAGVLAPRSPVQADH